MGSGHKRELTRKQNCIERLLRPAITERNSRTAKCGIFDHGCQQAEALIHSFGLIDVIIKWIANWLVGN